MDLPYFSALANPHYKPVGYNLCHPVFCHPDAPPKHCLVDALGTRVDVLYCVNCVAPIAGRLEGHCDDCGGYICGKCNTAGHYTDPYCCFDCADPG